jgi:hypothetical protein
MEDRHLEVETEIHLAGGDKIVLLKFRPSGDKTQENLVRLRANGALVWKAEPPEASAGDSWVAAEWVPDVGLVANSWSCWRVRIDPATGESIEKEFTK